MKTAGKYNTSSAKLIFLLPIFFMAWHCSSGGGGDSSSPATPAATYTVTYNGNGNTGGAAPADSNTYTSGANVSAAAKGSLVKAGSTFVGWNTQANGSGTTYAAGTALSMGSANMTLYARWTTATTYTVTYNGNTSTGGTAPVDGNAYLAGDTVTMASVGTLVKATGYIFANWNTLANGSGTNYAAGAAFTMGAANATLYAKWNDPPQYTLTYSGNGSTTGSPPASPVSYFANATPQVLDNTGYFAKAGYGFTGWNTLPDGSGTTYIKNQFFNIGTSNKTLYAKWEPVNCQQTVANPVTGTESLGGSCAVPNLIDNGNGTVSDTANNLLWVKCTVGPSSAVRETSIGNCSSASAATVMYQVPVTNPQATDACENLTYAGRSDWVLPDLKQLGIYYNGSGADEPYVIGSMSYGLSSYLGSSYTLYLTTTRWGTNSNGSVDFSKSSANGGGKVFSGNSTQGIVMCVVKLL